MLLVNHAGGRGSILVTMATTRALRRLCQETGPWCIAPTSHTTAEAVGDHFTASAVALVVEGGACTGPGATVMDCTMSPPRLRREGALPATFIEAALLMGARRPWWRLRSSRPPAE